jgi:hypothetical protein
MNAMTLNSEYRTRSIDDFTAELLESASSNTKLFGAAEEAELKSAEENYFPEEEHKAKEKTKIRLPWGIIATFIAMAVLLGLVAFVFRYTEILGFGNRKDPDNSSSESSQSETSDVQSYAIVMPNFIGRMRTDVENNTQYSEFNIVFEESNNNDYVAGMIFDQSVKYKTEVEKGTTVVLKVSTGPEKIPMPACIGKNVSEVSAMLTELGISFQLIPNYSSEYEFNIVYDQSVEAESEVTVGDRMAKVYIYYGALEGGGYDPWEDDDDDNGTSVGIKDILG